MRPTRRGLRAAWYLPPAAFAWTLLQTIVTPWTFVLACGFAIAAIPLGRWIDRETCEHGRY